MFTMEDSFCMDMLKLQQTQQLTYILNTTSNVVCEVWYHIISQAVNVFWKRIQITSSEQKCHIQKSHCYEDPIS